MSTTAVKSPKIADTNYPIHELLRKRWSPRAFSDEPVDTETFGHLLEAARWAPSAYNEQPWRFIVAQKNDEQAFRKLSSVLNDSNKQWATNAPVLGLGMTKRDFSHTGKSNRHAEHDLGQALAHLTFEAMHHDLYVHQMAGILPNKAMELYDLPGNLKPMTMFAIGYLGDPEQLDERNQKKETSLRSRRSLDEIVLKG